jgi:hypothetical protein
VLVEIRGNIFEEIHKPFLFDLDDDEQEDACRDERIRQRWNVKLL